MTERELTSRAEQTKSAIVTAALALFRENGYDATTMRAIASAAGVSIGNAYYYFGSKEELIREFYARNQAEHAAAMAAKRLPHHRRMPLERMLTPETRTSKGLC